MEGGGEGDWTGGGRQAVEEAVTERKERREREEGRRMAVKENR